MCHCLDIKTLQRVTLLTVYEDLVRGKDNSCYDFVVFGFTFCSGLICLLFLEDLVQNQAEATCCEKDPCCSKCLDEHCYVKTERVITGNHTGITARVTVGDLVVPLLMNS
jgi:hypothetical protein